jgi:GntR family transcriptional regulator
VSEQLGNHIPKFRQIKSQLAELISRGDYKPGDLLPSETELIDKYAVSRITVRNAIKELVNEGKVYVVHGKGTFVSNLKMSSDLPTLSSFTYDALKRGKKPSHKILLLETITSDKYISSILQIPPNAKLIHFDRLYLANEIPISIGFTYIPLEVVAPHQSMFNTKALEEKSMYDILNQIGIGICGGEQTISATSATKEYSNLLNVSINSPLLYAERIAYNEAKINIEYSRIVSRPDLNEWKVTLGKPETHFERR